jgi:S1-C subfamily serine protease
VVTVVVEQGEGSGVIWSSNGEIVTNNHVIEGASEVEVVLASGERMPATVVATDPLTDLAVLEVARGDLTAATFSDELPRVGTLVVAVGNPLGFENSATLGIVSGLNRAIPSGGASPALVDLLQTDAAISPGNSGGALIDLNGEVVGINVAYIPPAEQAVSLGFAIPAVTATSVVEDLLEDGKVEHSFLGIEPRPLTPEIASQLGLAVSEGVLVFSLTPDSAAEAGGIEPGDVIVEFNGEDIASIEDLYAALRDTLPGDTVPVTVVRGGADQMLEVTLQNRPEP